MSQDGNELRYVKVSTVGETRYRYRYLAHVDAARGRMTLFLLHPELLALAMRLGFFPEESGEFVVLDN